MKTEDRIRELADEFVAQAQARATRLQAELVDAHQRVEKIKAELDAARRAPQRLANFQVKRDGDYQCPKCGILHGVQAAMTGRPGEHRLGRFQCDTCGFDMDVGH